MKKLVLVTLMAVAASWLIFEARQPGTETLVMGNLHQRARRIQAVPEPHRLIVQHEGSGPAVIVQPPSPPEPPSPPGSIPVVTWRKGKGSRSQGPTPLPATVPTESAPSAKTPPSWFPKSELEDTPTTDAFGSRVIVGRLSASEDRARQDLRKIVDRDVADWIAADVPTSWKVPSNVINGMSQGSYVQEVTKTLIPSPPEAETSETPETPPVDGLYTLYRAGQKLDFSSARRTQILQMYRRDLAAQRMHRLGGGLALALVGLAVVSGYIRADEATKGYYTNRLRLLAAAGLGAAGVAAYRFLV